MTEFSELGLSPETLQAVADSGYTTATPIQAEAIPVALAGSDILGIAQTGTGKTAAFALPILSQLGLHSSSRRTARVLVLEPTRELAAQVETAFRDFARFTDLRTVAIFGGVGYGHQRAELRRGVDVIVATPGRLIDYLDEGTISLADIKVLVLDEVDRMLDMGFLPDVKRIVQQCPRERQTLLFTATLPPEIESLAAWVLKDPVTVAVGRQRAPAETVSHAFYPVVQAQKFELLHFIINKTRINSAVVFTRTRSRADQVARYLEVRGIRLIVWKSHVAPVEPLRPPEPPA